MLYPFGDSVVFRGNTETLRNISIRTDKETLAMLNKTGTFACGRFTALRTVKLLSYMDIIEGTNELAQETIKIYESIHGTVEHLQVMFSEASKRLLSRVQQGLTFDSLRQLDICEAHLSLRDIVRALKVLPALQRLRSRQAPVPTFIVLAQSAERVANFCQKHMRISASFQQWDIYYGAASPATSYSSVYAAFLSVICPHFTCLCVQYKCREKHYTNIARLQKTTFSAFAEDLQKLLVSYKPT
ncbi:hypothetical protein IW140_005307 [Coemansia sp. RSA 1813]|nr:hypothetical protein EV178_005270 [Coemansia sp. RSA 1646]KAJ1769850.1 hypothetical protein LPJ74_003697 [Coemansia sp. RSA 1843]KAJ2087039.1 hypothetical protein IW138_005258 [Coemansia sp. RSA 986]KAJ2211848.1 hypothetical protein EV179_005139 [Coemansia sp. RSA 487]KAJ2565499.1 hypothetical protein IW140_005307 [Coemansia sp. RSA 1813]